MAPLFLTLDEVLTIHADQVRRYGGAQGIRDLGLLESAAATPAATFDGRLLHATIPEMAAAYAFHIAQNHPFMDGNKRTALATALVFLWMNGHRIDAGEDDLVNLMVGVASGKISKSQLAVFFARHIR